MARKNTPTIDTRRYHVPNLDRALAIMEHLAAQQHPLGITDIAEALGFPKNSVFRIVSTLHAHAYLRRDEPAKQYSLTTKFLSLGYAAVHEGRLVENSLDVMRQVRDATGETVMVGIVDGHEGVVLEHMPSQQQLQVTVAVGARFELHTAAPGKAIMARLTADALDTMLDQLPYTRYTPRTITSKKALAAHLVTVREKGYAIDDAEHNEGIRCIGAAILNHRHHPVGAIWITAPAFRVPKEFDDKLGSILRDGAKRISSRFGHNG
jgi:IclR family KDG regulon transcriptional repressor